ncbi:hypothetical protein X759_24030 [Mesorhizobium sp. LSHC420B00]|nr:hypothetical protein X759_24030 [Mesorhizobium sp. LSHC420B00]
MLATEDMIRVLRVVGNRHLLKKQAALSSRSPVDFAAEYLRGLAAEYLWVGVTRKGTFRAKTSMLSRRCSH